MKFPRILILVSLALVAFPSLFARESISLAGEWRFQIDPDSKVESDRLFTNPFHDTISLPGTTDENKKGRPNTTPNTIELNRRYVYEGPAWYQRDIEIPQSWKGKRVVLFLERTRFTKVWFDDKLVGGDTRLSTPHEIVLTESARPGKHRLCIQVDNNRKRYPMHLSHVWADRIQTNWNGILGRIELIATDQVWIEEVQLYPDIEKGSVEARIIIGNNGGERTSMIILKADNQSEHTHPALIKKGKTQHVFTYHLENKKTLWDEFDPILRNMQVSLLPLGGNEFSDSRSIDFGMRKFSRQGQKFTINNQVTFLRGKHDAGVFPLTGYASMKEEDWENMFKTAASFGINFFRFHSWCPPEAAFRAADRLGIYLQPELPCWGSFARPGLPEYLKAEGEAILRTYGNHPSFVMFTLGNELGGDVEGRRALTKHLKELDPRRLYAQGSNNGFTDPEPLDVDDFWTVSATFREGGRVVFNIELTRGSMLHSYLGHINNDYPASTQVNYDKSTRRSRVPLISHETGQYLVYPDFNELPKYTGTLRPYPMEVFRERAEKAGLLDQADQFFHASGKLSAICYKEDMESVLRTRGMGGYALLDLQDYPGQGSAWVGMCNAFMEPKAFINPAWFKQFCSPVTPLLRFDKRTWTSGESFHAKVEVAQYHKDNLSSVRPTVRLLDSAGKVLAEQTLGTMDLPAGGVREIGSVEIPLGNLAVPQQLKCEVLIPETEYRNEYDLWLYPDTQTYSIPKTIDIVEFLDEDVIRKVKNGASVLVLPRVHDLGNSIEGQFISNFWTIAFFKSYRGAGTLGLLMDPEHPVFKHFPTEFHSNWQWWPMARHGRPVIMDHFPRELRPLVQVIDNFETSRKLGLLFEARLGKGKLLFSSMDLLNHRDKPEVRQLLFSILRYMESEDFAPKVEVNEEQLQRLFRPEDDSANTFESAENAGIHG